MTLLSQLPIITISLALIATHASAKETPPTITTPPPQELSATLKTSLAKVRASCVAVYSKGYGSGVIISPDGLVLTAAHMMRNHKENDDLKVTLEDGRSLKATLLGFNRETDFALLQITQPTPQLLPYCELAKTTVITGGFCFTFAHPSGRLKGRPAQVRIGRVTTHSIQRDRPFYLFADCNIQPGDSGGPLFSMDGKLIGLDSSAAGNLGLNIFSAIDQFHLDKKRLLKKDRWGDDQKAPDGPSFTKVTLNPAALKKIEVEFMKQYKAQYPPTVDFIQSLNNNNGTVQLDQLAMVNHLPVEAIAISRDQPISLGLADPELTQQLPPLPANVIRGIALYDGTNRLGKGLPIAQNLLITKASLLPKEKIITIHNGKKTIKLKRLTTNQAWDLTILQLADDVKLPAIQWPSPQASAVQPGDLLMARDQQHRMIWNIATDQARPVTKKRSIGPLKDKSIISQHRAPYPRAIRHALTLTAKDAGTPIFNEKGVFIGIHIARFSRTMGLIIPAKQLREECSKMLASLKKTTKNHQVPSTSTP